MNMPARYPERIVCLTEETTETLYLLGEERRIVGISGYTVRPPQARRDKPRVSAFLSAKTDKILTLEPDLVIGFSDLQADIARDSRRCRSRPAIDGMPEDRLSIFHIKRDATASRFIEADTSAILGSPGARRSGRAAGSAASPRYSTIAVTCDG